MAKPKIRHLAIFVSDPANRRTGMKCAGAVFGLAFALVTQVEAAEIKIISSGGARAVMTSIVPEFERKSGHKVGIGFGTPGDMRDRLLHGSWNPVAGTNEIK